MCALCGVLGGDGHWTDPVKREGIYVRTVTPDARRRERLLRIAEANASLKLFGLSLEDWHGSSYILRNQTGKSEIVVTLAGLWPAAEALSGRLIDPLDPLVLARRERLNG